MFWPKLRGGGHIFLDENEVILENSLEEMLFLSKNGLNLSLILTIPRTKRSRIYHNSELADF